MNILEENEESDDLTFEELCNVLDTTCRNSGVPPLEAITALEIVKHELMHLVTRVTTVTSE